MRTTNTTPRRTRLVSFLAASAGLALVISAQGCSSHDDSSGDGCQSLTGPVDVAPACSTGTVKGSTPERLGDVFRTHSVAASSALGIVNRQVEGVVGWLFTCVLDAVGHIIVGAVTGDVGTPTCGAYDQAASYAFDGGTYRFDLRQSVSFYKAPLIDTENSATLQFVFTKDVGSFKAGAVVPNDLGRADSFLVGLKVTAAGIAYDRPGPLVELLGLGANPPNPIPLTSSTGQKVQDSIRGALAFQGSTHANLMDCEYRTDIQLTIDPTPVTSDVHPKLVAATTKANGGTEPLVTAKTWDVVYSESSRANPQGQITADLPTDTLATTATVKIDATDPTKSALSLDCAPR